MKSLPPQRTEASRSPLSDAPVRPGKHATEAQNRAYAKAMRAYHERGLAVYCDVCMMLVAMTKETEQQRHDDGYPVLCSECSSVWEGER